MVESRQRLREDTLKARNHRGTARALLATQGDASPRRIRAKARFTIQPRARRSASAGYEGVANLPAAEAAGTTPPNSQHKRNTPALVAAASAAALPYHHPVPPPLVS